MKRGFHDLSDNEVSDVTEELMMPTGVFGALLIAGLMCLALIWHPLGLFEHAARPPAAATAMRPSIKFLAPKPTRLSARQASHHVIAPD
jgi:hypothetical protein